MIFTEYSFLIYFFLLFPAYWLFRKKEWQNILLLIASYVFYGWVHPWFCILIATSTIVDFFIGLSLVRYPDKKKFLLSISLICNLGMLGFFKYFNFFTDSIVSALNILGLSVEPLSFSIFLPVGISFYTFQTLSYTIEIYYGKMQPRKNFIDFALFVAFFPQLVAGPIERARRFLPQIEVHRQWDWQRLPNGLGLICMGYLKKIVIADSVAVFANKVFLLQEPTFLLLLSGTLAFTLQIFADFSGYTDLARGFAKLIGFDLIDNFNAPYLAISPSDFWRRWHISFSTWIRDYIYIPLGGSRGRNPLNFLWVLLITFGLSGLWHGAAWHYVIWGIYHALLLFAYHQLGLGGRWQPEGLMTKVLAWAVMFTATVFGWMLFRTPDMAWLLQVFRNIQFGNTGDSMVVSIAILSLICLYAIPLYIKPIVYKFSEKMPVLPALYYAFAIILILIFLGSGNQDFIYFQF